MRLGTYEILSQLGAGGMGEVYRAQDTKLGRDVALKLLPETFTHDPERLVRFRREAQVLASLNHSHIGAIYGLEEVEGQQFLVLELVDGESLDKRITRGPIPIFQALAIAKQIAEALEAAHDKGIIHRDLKPANIALTIDGSVKVLDFGLAKATEVSGATADLANSPTITSPAMMTGLGMILGTAAYMSPEQVKGNGADRRSDIWAFGCVLFEILTGTRAFAAADISSTVAKVIEREPDWSHYEPLNNRAGGSAENSGVVVIRAAIIQFSERKNNSRPSRAQAGHMPPSLHDEERRAALFTHVMHRADMGMLELRDATSFPVEALSELRIRREVFREDLDRHDAIEPRIPRFIHLPHATDAERRHDFVRAESRSWNQRHQRLLRRIRKIAPQGLQIREAIEIRGSTKDDLARTSPARSPEK